MRIFISTIVGFIVSFLVTTTAQAQEDWVIIDSNHSVSETADKLVGIIENAPPKLFARIDHAAGAKSIDMELANSTLIIFGAPQIGTPIMQENILAGLDLPIRVLIWDDNGQTKIGYLDPQALKTRYSINGAEKAFKGMAGAIAKMTNGAAN